MTQHTPRYEGQDHVASTSTDRWKALEAKGARPQRPLWASTGVKNPELPDTLYISELIAPGTVNTMPEKTLMAYADHGSPGTPVQKSYEDAAAVMQSVRDAGVDPLLHYIEDGEQEGRQPIAHFDPGWYRSKHEVPDDELCLAHFLRNRRSGTVSPVPEFDAAAYVARYPDVLAADMDPFEHYLVQGAEEGRAPSAEFDPAYLHLRSEDGAKLPTS